VDAKRKEPFDLLDDYTADQFNPDPGRMVFVSFKSRWE
jgi:hypothetical protein